MFGWGTTVATSTRRSTLLTIPILRTFGTYLVLCQIQNLCTYSAYSYRNFCIDEFARYDIPDSIEYILKVTGEKSLSYIGFSQGTAQAFAALSICPTLNTKVDVFVALAPAMSPPGLSAPIVDGLMKASYVFPSP